MLHTLSLHQILAESTSNAPNLHEYLLSMSVYATPWSDLFEKYIHHVWTKIGDSRHFPLANFTVADEESDLGVKDAQFLHPTTKE